MADIGLVLLSFLSGAVPYALWFGHVFLRVDIREFGDGNPGATNVFRAGNNYLGLLVLVLDVTKSALPVGVAYNILNIRGLMMFLIALAPVVGHIFSPFLGFRGGKGLAAAFGTWIGLTVWKISAPAAAAAAIGILVFSPAGWAVGFALVVVLAWIFALYPDPLLFATWFMQAVLLVWTHRADLRQLPRLRRWWKNWTGE